MPNNVISNLRVWQLKNIKGLEILHQLYLLIINIKLLNFYKCLDN